MEAGQELDKLDSLLRTMLQRPEFASLAGPGDAPPAIQTPPATSTPATTPRAAARAQAVTEASPPLSRSRQPVPAGTKPGAPVRAAAPPLAALRARRLGGDRRGGGRSCRSGVLVRPGRGGRIPDSELAERIQLGRAVVWLDEGPTAQALAVLARISGGGGGGRPPRRA